MRWEQPSSALRRLYAISQQPDCARSVNELWRQAWPKTFWSELAGDGMSEVWPPDMPGACSFLEIDIQISSDEPLQLPWNWLAVNLLYAPAAGFKYCLNASTLQVQEEPYIHVSLRRPAQAGQLQLIMYKGLRNGSDTWSGNEDADDTCSLPWWDDNIDHWRSDTIYAKPSHLQKVAITGTWCQVLPDAVDLWPAHIGHDVCGVIVEDDIAVDVGDLPKTFEHYVDY